MQAFESEVEEMLARQAASTAAAHQMFSHPVYNHPSRAGWLPASALMPPPAPVNQRTPQLPPPAFQQPTPAQQSPPAVTPSLSVVMVHGDLPTPHQIEQAEHPQLQPSTMQPVSASQPNTVPEESSTVQPAAAQPPADPIAAPMTGVQADPPAVQPTADPTAAPTPALQPEAAPAAQPAAVQPTADLPL